MNRFARLILIVALALPLVVTGCFSSNPPRGGSGSPGGSPDGSPGGTPGGSPGGTSGSSPGGSSDGTIGGHRGVPDTPQGNGSMGVPTPGSQSGREGGERGSGDTRVATAGKTGTDGDSSSEDGTNSDSAGTGTGDGQTDVSVAEALEGANAAVDAASEAVEEAESTIARARDELESGSNGKDESFDPWAKGGASGEGADGDGGAAVDEAADDGPERAADRQGSGDADNDSFDPFSDYGDPDEEAQSSERRIPRGNSLETADDAVDAARAALNRARRSLIKAASAGSGDADAEAVQLSAARAAMEAAAEAVIASAIAVMAATDAMSDDGEFSAEDAQDAEERLAEGIAMVVAITQRDMRNAGEALEATGELLSAAGSLIGMLGKTDRQQDNGDDLGGSNAERVASLEEELDQSLSVFDDRMDAEIRNTGSGTMVSEDSETAGLPSSDGRMASNSSGGGVGGRSSSNGGAMGDQQIGDPNVKERYETPAGMERTETEQFVIEAGRAQDDDIVARQLREAAMAETDPELREALWKEYKNYKESLELGEAEAN